MTRNRMLAAWAAVLTVGALGLAGCGVSTTDSGSTEAAMMDGGALLAEGEMMPEAAMPGPMTDKSGVAPALAGPDVVIDRSIIRTAYIAVRVDAVDTAVREVHELTDAAGGIVVGENLTGTEGDAYATVTAQVPADALDAYLERLRGLGSVDSLDVTAQDVTTQVVDLDARIAALETSIERLTTLMSDATRVEDLLAAEAELSRRQAEVDSLVAQRTYLAEQVAMSTVTVSLTPVTPIADLQTPGFWSGLQSGWSAFASLLGFAITALGFLVPFLIVAAIIAVPVTIVLVRRSRRAHRVQTWDDDGGDGSASRDAASSSPQSSSSPSPS